MSTAPNFRGRKVLAFESRRASEMRNLIEAYGGHAVIAPAMQELPVGDDDEIVALARGIIRDDFDAVVFLTGVGARAAFEAADRHGLRNELLAALARVRIVARGPKPVAALREVGLSAWVNAPEPNTWRELVGALDARAADWSLAGQRVAVQEYGVSNGELLEALRDRGAIVTAVQTYRWAMPDDLAPMREAAAALVRGEIDVVLITTGVQLIHFARVAAEMGIEGAVRDGLGKAILTSIGPSASAECRRHGLEPAMEASHPKMGYLVREAAALVAG